MREWKDSKRATASTYLPPGLGSGWVLYGTIRLTGVPGPPRDISSKLTRSRGVVQSDRTDWCLFGECVDLPI
jgi:hypothetical protein